MSTEAVKKASQAMQKELDAYKNKKHKTKEYFTFMKESTALLAAKESK